MQSRNKEATCDMKVKVQLQVVWKHSNDFRQNCWLGRDAGIVGEKNSKLKQDFETDCRLYNNQLSGVSGFDKAYAYCINSHHWGSQVKFEYISWDWKPQKVPLFPTPLSHIDKQFLALVLSFW